MVTDVVVMSKKQVRGAMRAVRHKQFGGQILCGGVRELRPPPPEFPADQITECRNCARLTEGDDSDVPDREAREGDTDRGTAGGAAGA